MGVPIKTSQAAARDAGLEAAASRAAAFTYWNSWLWWRRSGFWSRWRRRSIKANGKGNGCQAFNHFGKYGMRALAWLDGHKIKEVSLQSGRAHAFPFEHNHQLRCHLRGFSGLNRDGKSWG